MNRDSIINPFRAALSLPILLCLSACTIGGSTGVGVENNRLRDELAAAKAQITQLSAQRDELTTKLALFERARAGAIPFDILSAMPAPAGIRIGSLSGIHPADRATPATRVDLYIEPFDGRDRFIQIVGTLSVEIDALAPVADRTPPRSLASVTLTPSQVRDAYRAGFTGTHYSVELTLNTPLNTREGSLAMRVRFNDAISGREFKAERVVDLSTK